MFTCGSASFSRFIYLFENRSPDLVKLTEIVFKTSENRFKSGQFTLADLLI
jgi:hypothetical protein